MGALDGKIAIITGATSGIGERAAELFVEEGATVVLSGRRAELGQAIAARLGQNAHFVRADMADQEAFTVKGPKTTLEAIRSDMPFYTAGTARKKLA